MRAQSSGNLTKGPKAYHAKYVVTSIEDAAKLIQQMDEGAVSSFGDGDEQWEGIYMSDPGAEVTIRNFAKDRWAVEVTVPISVVPKNYWFSPHLAEGIMTLSKLGRDNRSEAHTWGLIVTGGGQ